MLQEDETLQEELRDLGRHEIASTMTGSRAASAARRHFATAAKTGWSVNHYEGYTVFWSQNTAEHTPASAPPVPAAAIGKPSAAHRQSVGVRYFQGGVEVPVSGLIVPPDPAYVLPVGTRMPSGADANALISSGTVISRGRKWGPSAFNSDSSWRS